MNEYIMRDILIYTQDEFQMIGVDVVLNIDSNLTNDQEINPSILRAFNQEPLFVVGVVVPVEAKFGCAYY